MLFRSGKYKYRLTLSAGEQPSLTLKLKPGEDVPGRIFFTAVE